MSFGMEVHYKGDSNKDEEFVHLVSESYDHSLSYNVPYLLATFVVVFPSEYVIAHVLFAKSPAVYYLTALVPSCAVAYFAGRYLERKVFSRLEIGTRMDATTTVVASALLVLGVVSLGFYDVMISQINRGAEASAVGKIPALLAFGIVPIRVYKVFFSERSLVNRGVGIGSILFYVSRQIGVF